MNNEEYVAKLNEVYDGAVKPFHKYLNDHAVIGFKCEKCGLAFFNKTSHMVGKESQRHVCNVPYGDSQGERLLSVSSTKVHKKKKADQSEAIWEQFYQMVIEDFTYQQIASKLKVNPEIIKDYFLKEGLI